MNHFHKIVLIIATVVLIISLCIIGFFLTKSLYFQSFPPIISDCPDYWDISMTSDGYICINNYQYNNVINENCGISNEIIDAQFNNNYDLCEKYKKVQKCNLAWDGVSNNTNPCNDLFN